MGPLRRIIFIFIEIKGIRLSCYSSGGNITGFQIYRKTASESKYVKIATVEDWSLYYIDGNVKEGETYDYKVRTYFIDYDGSVYCGKFSPVKTIKRVFTIGKVSVHEVSNSVRGTQIEWFDVDGATGYQVYRKGQNTVNGTAVYSKISTLKDSSFIDSTAAIGKTYYYKVRAYYKDKNGNVFYGPFSDVEKYTRKSVVDKVKGANAWNKAKGIDLSWFGVDGATGYQIYRKAGSDEKFSKIKTVSAWGYAIDKNVKVGETYSYKIRAYYEDGTGTIYYGAFSDVATIERTVGVPEVDLAFVSIWNTGDGIDIEWEWDSYYGVTGYQIYRKSSSETKYSRIVAKSKKSLINEDNPACCLYSDETAKLGETYSYKIRAYYKDADGNVYYGDFCPAIKIKRANKVGTITWLEADVESSHINLSWSYICGAKGYQVYRKGSKDTKYTKIGTDSSTLFTDCKVEKGETYSYKVRAYMKDKNGNVYYGDFSPVISRKY